MSSSLTANNNLKVAFGRRFFMDKPQRQQKMTTEEYLRFEEEHTEKHEYVNGRIFAMTGGTIVHNLISTNIVRSLHAQLKGSGCRVYMADVKLRVEATNCFYYPDVMVECGATHDKSSVFIETPVLIFEVLSRSTASTDRREKLLSYQQIASLEAYIIVHQSRKRLEIYRRLSQDDWTIQHFGPAEVVELSWSNEKVVTVAVDEIYEDTIVEDSPDFQVSENIEVYIY